MWALWRERNRMVAKLATITGFVVAFAGWVESFTTAQRKEVITATAAHTAVLVVFISKVAGGKKHRRFSSTSVFGMAPRLAARHLIFHQLPNLLIILSSTQQIPHLLTILCSTCRPKHKDKLLHSRLPLLEPPSSMQSSSLATYERRLTMDQFNPSASERTSSSSYITTRMAETFLHQDKLCGFSMGKSLTRCRRKSPKVQQCGLKKFVFP